MRTGHRTPAASWFAIPESDPVDPAYEAEVQQATQRAERDHQRAQDRLARAERRLAAARRQQARAADRKRIRALEELVAERRAQLRELERLMQQAPLTDGPNRSGDRRNARAVTPKGTQL